MAFAIVSSMKIEIYGSLKEGLPFYRLGIGSIRERFEMSKCDAMWRMSENYIEMYKNIEKGFHLGFFPAIIIE